MIWIIKAELVDGLMGLTRHNFIEEKLESEEASWTYFYGL